MIINMTEHDIQNQIRINCSDIAILFRANVGSFKTNDGRFISTGLPAGFPDLFGVRLSDGRAVFIEVKKPNGKIRPQQIKFINRMSGYGFIAGIAYSVEDAKKIILEG